MSQNFQLIPASRYLEAVYTLIEAAEKRIVIHAMVVAWQPPLADKLTPLLTAALNRGVSVTIVGDAYSKLSVVTEHPLASLRGSGWRYTALVNRELRHAGAEITYVGTLGMNPFAKRCHSKITIIDDTILSFGGVNFYTPAFDANDYLLKTSNQKLADTLQRLVQDIGKNSHLNDFTKSLDNKTTLLFDAGREGVSEIYSTALKTVATAQKVYFVSQMCPTGPLAQAIRSVDSVCYFNRPSQASPSIAAALLYDITRNSIKNSYKRDRYLHAKFILTEDSDGTRHVISGSHNFNWRGVAYGTREIALHSTDPTLWQTLYNYMQQNIC